MSTEERRKARWITRHWPLVSGVSAVGLAAAGGAVIAFRGTDVEFDTEWNDGLLETRSPYFEVPARLMDFLGGGWFGVLAVPILVAVLLILTKHRWGALYFVIASALSAGVVQLLKNLFDRARPEDILVVADHGSFPSGHVANAATIAVTLGIILRRTWVWIGGVAYAVLMMLSRTYLGAHWLSDTVGGLLVGAGMAVVVWAPFAARLQRERTQRDRVAA
ncbi:phosphatase PAP2 family protein [Lysobacter korlensis]|uniref:undecaprenyl-diphosphate phosphatase n=1 Tax=Lysobacter korlensis TaxID=553636 RepID=A0ABV6RY79_9GAMM